MESRVQGAAGTMQSFGVITTEVTANQGLSLSADFSQVGAATYTALVLDQGNVVYTLPGIANGDGLVAESTGNPSDPPPYPKAKYIIVRTILGGAVEFIQICITIKGPPGIKLPNNDAWSDLEYSFFLVSLESISCVTPKVATTAGILNQNSFESKYKI